MPLGQAATTPFARFFKLKAPERNDFRLRPAQDAALYVDLDGVLERLGTEMGNEAPKFVVEGDFGTGKSHVLQYVAQHMAVPQFEPVYITLAGFERRSDFYIVHRAIMGGLMPLVRAMMQLPSDRRPDISAFSHLGEDMKRALSGLAYQAIGKPHADAVAAEQWLMDSRLLTASRATKAGYGGTLREKASPIGLVELYKTIGELHAQMHGRKLLLLLDEGESFTRVVDLDAQVSIGQGLRGLFDPDNRSIGLFLGLNTPRTRVGTHPLLRSDVRSRIGDRLLALKPLNAPDRILRFLKALWPNLTKERTSLPFLLDQSALTLISNRLDELRQQVFADEQLAPSPTPRDLLEVLSVLGQAAVTNHADLPLSGPVIVNWFKLNGT